MSEPEELLAFQLKAVGVPFEREVLFAKELKRRWRADFVVRDDAARPPNFRYYSKPPLLIEIDGGTWSGGRHVTGSGHASDSEKRNAAVLLGYRPLTFTPEQVESGEALAQIERCIGEKE